MPFDKNPLLIRLFPNCVFHYTNGCARSFSSTVGTIHDLPVFPDTVLPSKTDFQLFDDLMLRSFQDTVLVLKEFYNNISLRIDLSNTCRFISLPGIVTLFDSRTFTRIFSVISISQ